MKNFKNTLVLLGGNLGNVKETFEEAIKLLMVKLGQPVLSSSLYESEPWGFEARQHFLNQVVEFRCTLEPMDLLAFTQSVELTLGRKNKTGSHYESRPIDIDILFIGRQCISKERLSVPHPQLHRRLFTLLPLMEHWSDYEHPLLRCSIRHLHHQCTDSSKVTKKD